MRPRLRLLAVVAMLLALCPVAHAAPLPNTTLHLTVRPTADGTDVPVHAIITLPAPDRGALQNVRVQLRAQDKDVPAVPGQLVPLDDNKAELWWILPTAKANVASDWTATVQAAPDAPAPEDTFSLHDEPGDHLDVLFAGRPVTRFMYARDTSTKARAAETFKPFLHVFDPTGKDTITKGPGGLYTHHRGIFIGWRDVAIDKEPTHFDLWHMPKGEAQVHQKFIQEVAGPVLARTNALINWNDTTGRTLLSEQRETTVFRQPAPTVALIEFHSRLTAVAGDIALGGDLEHAGIHFRAHDDAGKLPADYGKTSTSQDRSIPAQWLFPREGINPDKEKDMPWVGMSFALHDKRYSVEQINPPTNPHDTIFSAHRPYARFGAFFKQTVKKGETLDVTYRFWIVDGAMPSRDTMNQEWSALAHAPVVTVE